MKQNDGVISLYCFSLPQCEDLCSCCSGFLFATVHRRAMELEKIQASAPGI